MNLNPPVERLNLIETWTFLRETTNLIWCPEKVDGEADVDFTDANLEECDMRRCTFENVRFVQANLSGADLRMSSFENCDFTGANMAGAKMRRSQAKGISLSEQQRQQIDWKRRDGKEPPGG